MASLPLEVRRHICFVRFNQSPELAEATHEELERLSEEMAFGCGRKGSKSNPDNFSRGESQFIIEDLGEQGGRLLAPTDPATAARPWRVAVVDLDGHFAAAIVIAGALVLINTTENNYLRGGGALLATAMAHDVLLKRGLASPAACSPAAGGAGAAGGVGPSSS